MNWVYLRPFPWLDTRARFVSGTPRGGTLLDLGSAEGETLCHIAEMRPDLRLFAADLAGQPANYPVNTQFVRADLERDLLPWPDASMDSITCMHLVEHLSDLKLLLNEVTRLLKSGGRAYFETPHPKTLSLSSVSGRAAGSFTMNFYDDLGHIRPVSVGGLAQQVREARMEVVAAGTSRNWLFAALWPWFLFLPTSRKKLTARAHWIGWSAFLVGKRSA
jgi:ubiquinone/menaquinone biosynthesis C-methylase UbiE